VSWGVLDWDDVPPDLQNDPVFGRSVLCKTKGGSTGWSRSGCFCETGNEAEFFTKVFASSPELKNDRGLWVTIVASDYYDDALDDLLLRCAPAAILDDQELMMQAVIAKNKCLSVMRAPLATNFAFVSACVEQNISCLAYVPEAFVGQFPDYVKSKFVDFERGDNVFGVLSRLVWTLHKQFDSRPDFFTAWFDAGLPIDKHEAFNAWRNDRELLLRIAELRSWSSKVSFRNASESLRNDPNFMTEAVGRYSELYQYTSK
jgi:hypothetical protein